MKTLVDMDHILLHEETISVWNRLIMDLIGELNLKDLEYEMNSVGASIPDYTSRQWYHDLVTYYESVIDE